MNLQLEKHVPLAPLTYFRVGGTADILCRIHNKAELQELASYLQDNPRPVFLLGAGSNLIIRDGGIRGCVIHLEGEYNQALPLDFHDEFLEEYADYEQTHPNERLVVARGGEMLARVAFKASEAGINGFGGLATIPGTIGGAIKGNAGAFLNNSDQVCKKVRGLDLATGQFHTYYAHDLDFSYRHSNLPDNFVVTEVVMAGALGDTEEILARIKRLKQKRIDNQPVDRISCGSTFKNPETTPAWQLIDAAGCRGLTIGGAQMSTKHSNFLINTGNATAADLENLGEEVRRRVLETSGIQLEWEIKRLGEPL